MCPHCRQAYYGTGERGHLVPQRFTCVRCAHEIDEAEMVLLPTAGVSESQTVAGIVPWRERAKRGRLWAFFATIGLASFLPHRLGRSYGNRVNWPEAAVFALVASTVYTLGSIGWCGGLYAFVESSRLGIQGSGVDYVMIAWSGAKWVLIPMVVACVGLTAWALSAHAVLRLKNPKPPALAETAECFAYAWGAAFLTAVPCVGIQISPLAIVWVAVSAMVQMTVRFGVSSGRAVWAGLALPLVVVAVLTGWIGWRLLRG